MALVNGVPQTLDLKAFLTHFLEFRVGGDVQLSWGVVGQLGDCCGCFWAKPSSCKQTARLRSQVDVVERRARHALGKAQARLHLVEGYLSALKSLDAVVKVGTGRVRRAYSPCSHDACGSSAVLRRCRHTPLNAQVIRSAPDAAAAKAALSGPGFGLSDAQAEGVLGLTLRRLTGLEVGKLQEEEATLISTITGLQVPHVVPSLNAARRTAGELALAAAPTLPMPSNPPPYPQPSRSWVTAPRCCQRWCARLASWRRSTAFHAARAWCRCAAMHRACCFAGWHSEAL